MMKHRLNEKWIKASIAGTMWAASEIVLGSFLHNLKVPFSGNILTAIGIIILISISYLWKDRGLFWRAGIICALMKTMSPSAVIFGPMIAILAESLLLELSVRIFGRTLVGYALGSMAAMSWNLFQKIINYIIFYGSNIIEVYSDLLKYAQKQLSIKTDIVWMPIIILLVLYASFGLLAAIAGIRVGRRMTGGVTAADPQPSAPAFNGMRRNGSQQFDYSVTWLVADLILIIGAFIILNRASWMVWVPAIAAIITVWATRYKRALRQLSRPGFWIFFVFITLLTAFLFTGSNSEDHSLLRGLLTGVQMNFRAAVIIVGFSVLGTELYNPVVRNFFMRTSFKNLPLAMELSAESLPLFIASIPDYRTFRKNPVSVMYQVLSHAEKRFSEIQDNENSVRKVIIVTGSVRGGKTTFVKDLIGSFHPDAGVYGILSERITDGDATTGYDVVGIGTGLRKSFLRENSDCDAGRIGRFGICSEGLRAGLAILKSQRGKDKSLVIIDEVGMLELQGGGWSEGIEYLLGNTSNHILMTVRDIFVDKVKEKWLLSDAVVLNIRGMDQSAALASIHEMIR
jgi:nucleoside-triphosphatase THEP1